MHPWPRHFASLISVALMLSTTGNLKAFLRDSWQPSSNSTKSQDAEKVPASLVNVDVVLSTSGADAPSLKSLYEGHRWFELRDAIRGKAVLPLYRGATSSAFNQFSQAEKNLQEAIRTAVNAEDANEARGALAYLYARSGRYRDVVRQFDEMLKAQPGRLDVDNARALFAAFSRYPDQVVVRSGPSKVSCQVNGGGITIPVTIKGRTVHWGLDTGVNFSVISESEARLLGLRIQDVRAQMGDLNAGVTSTRTAVAERLSIGRAELRNVAFLVIPDSQPPVDRLPPTERGLIGLPVVLALKTFRWSGDGTFEVGFRSRLGSGGNPNLCFDGLVTLTRARFEGKDLDFIFDTGNGAGTQLWARFAKDFSALLKEHGSRGVKRVTQFGGSNEREVTMLPEVRLQVGGLDVALRPANIFSPPVGNDLQHGLLGMDLLSQARRVTVDFEALRLTLE